MYWCYNKKHLYVFKYKVILNILTKARWGKYVLAVVVAYFEGLVEDSIGIVPMYS